MANTSDDSRVTVAQIAELASVTSSAVSNWRRRHADFPEAVETLAGGREVFSLREVETWLRDSRGVQPEMEVTKYVWQLADLVRGLLSSDEMVEFLCSVVTFVHLDGSPTNVWPSAGEIEQRTGMHGLFHPLERVPPEILDRAISIASEIPKAGQAEVFTATLDRQSRLNEWRTPGIIADLLVQLSSNDNVTTLLDPAAGTGGFLIAAAQSMEGLNLHGQEMAITAWRIAHQNLMIHGVDAELMHGDAFAEDRFPNERFDVVLCDPPYSGKPRLSTLPVDLQWSFGPPPRNNTDYWWIQYVVNHLSDEGRGYLLLPLGSLYRHGLEQKVRQELVRRGAVEAVIGLPSAAGQYSQIPLALWILKRPVTTEEPDPILFVDGVSTSDSKSELDPQLVGKVVAVVQQHREGRSASEALMPAATVKVLDILGADVDLNPARWVEREGELDLVLLDEAWSSVTSKLRQVEEFASGEFSQTSIDMLPERASQWISVRDLSQAGIVQVIKGRTVKPAEFVSQGVRALRIRDIGDGRLVEAEPAYVPADGIEEGSLTQPGDVIVSPGPSKPRAAVDQTGGNLVVSPLHILRFRQEWLDPDVTAASISSRRNLRFLRGSTHPRVNVQDLELPVLKPEDGQALRDALIRVKELETRAADVVAAARTAREALINLGATGQ